jgi:hypothetical protein
MTTVENNCKCHAIYNGHGHIKRRARKEKFLGSKHQFCAAFYHVHEWDNRQHFCLDENHCIIAQEAKKHIKTFVDGAKKFSEEATGFANKANEFVKDAQELEQGAKEFATKQKICAEEANEFIKKGIQFAEKAKSFKMEPKNATNKTQKKLATKIAGQLATKANELAEKAKQLDVKAKKAVNAWCVEPEAVVAVVNFEKIDGRILYEARYTNCRKEKRHAEDFFKEDIEKKNGVLAEIVRDNPNGTITMYLTILSCNISTSETENTNPDQTFCDILKSLRNNGRNIKLCIKATHTNRSLTEQEDTLRHNAERGIKQLMRIEGVNVSGMTSEDWDYLFSMTESIPPRRDLDREVQKIFERIHGINLP